jgi:hypothetical protein
MAREANPCAKRVTPETAYEVYQTLDGQWTYYVLRKYKSPTNEARDLYARWLVATVSPMTHGSFEYGDAYVSSIKRDTLLVDNPLHRFLCIKGASLHTLEEIGLSKFPITDLVLRDVRLWQYLRLSIPPKDFGKVRRTLEEHEIAIVCIDAANFLEQCLEDVQTSMEQKDHGTFDKGA